MFEFRDLFQWDRFITPTIIKSFYWLVIVLTVLFGISGIFSGLATMAISPFGGFILVLSSLAGIVVGIVFSRIVAEFVLIVFRINDHLGAIREQGGLRELVPRTQRSAPSFTAWCAAEPGRRGHAKKEWVPDLRSSVKNAASRVGTRLRY